MTQYETVLNRISETKARVEGGIIEKTANLFDGMDEKMVNAAKTLKSAKDNVIADRGLNPEGRERRLRDLEEQHFEPVKQEYFDRVRQARELVSGAIGEIEAAALPQTDTGAERAPNIAIWQFEVSQAKPDDWGALYAEHADDKDYVKLMEIAAKGNPSSRAALATASAKKSTAMQSKTLAMMQRLSSSLSLSAYAYGLGDYLRGISAAVNRGDFYDSNSLDMIMWNNLLNYDASRMPQSAR